LRKQKVGGRRERTIVEGNVGFVLGSKSKVTLHTLDTIFCVVPLDKENYYEKLWHPETLLVDMCASRPS
jgi:hypothetical protein